MTFNTSELFVLNDIFKNLLKASEITLNLFERNSVSEEELKADMILSNILFREFRERVKIIILNLKAQSSQISIQAKRSNIYSHHENNFLSNAMFDAKAQTQTN